MEKYMSGIVIEVEGKSTQAEASLEKLNEIIKSLTNNIKNVDKNLNALSIKKEIPLDKTEKALNKISPKLDELNNTTTKFFKNSNNIDNKYAKEFRNIGDSAETAGKRVSKAFNDITLKPNETSLKNFSNEIDKISKNLSKQISGNLSKKDLKDTENNLNLINQSVTGISNSISRTVGAIGLGIAALGSTASFGVLIKSLSDVTSSFTEIESKIALVTGKTAEFTEAQQALLKVANETRTTYASTVDAFSGIGRAMKDVGATSEQLFKVTKALQQTQALSGSSTESFKAAMMQLNQGLSSGTLRGEELNSVLEQAPAIADALAKSLNVSVGSLKGIAEQGKLTTSVVFGALLKQADYINNRFKLLSPTLGNALASGYESAKRFGFELDKGLGLSQDLAKALTKITSGVSGRTTGIRILAADFDVKLKEAIIRVKAYLTPLRQVVKVLGEEFYRVFSSWKIPEDSQKPLDSLIRKFTLLKFVLMHTDPGADTRIIFRRMESAVKTGIEGVSDLINTGIKLNDKFILPIIDKIKDLYPEAKAAIIKTFNKLNIVFEDSVKLLAKGFEIGVEFTEPIIEALNKLPAKITVIFDKISKALILAASSVNAMANSLADVLDSITTKTYNLDAIYEYLTIFKDKVINVFFKIWDAVIGHSWWTDTIDTIIYTSEHIWDNASPGLIKFKDSVINLFKAIATTTKTIFNDALEKLNINPVSVKIPLNIEDATVQFDDLYKRFVKTFDKFKEDFPLLFKAIATGLGAVLVGLFLPSGNFALLLEAALISASIQSATLFAETLGRDLGDASLVAGLGTNLGKIVGQLFASFLSNLPLILSSLLGFIGEFTKEFLKQLPIIGYAFKGIFGLASGVGLAGPLGLLGAFFFGKSILGILKTFGIAEKAIKAFESKLEVLSGFFGGQGGFVSKLLFGGGRGFRIGALLLLFTSLSGAFDGLFNDSNLGKVILNGGLLYFFIFGKEGLKGFSRILMLVRANIVEILREFAATTALADRIAAGAGFGPVMMQAIRNFRNFFRGLTALSVMFFSSSLHAWADYFAKWTQVTGFSGNILNFFKGFYDKIFGPITSASYSFAPLAQSFVAVIVAIKDAIKGYILAARAAGVAMGGWIAAFTRMLLGAPGILILVGLISALFSKSADAAERFREESNKGFFENLTDNLAKIDISGFFTDLWNKLNAIDFSGLFGTSFKISIWTALTAVTSLFLLFSTNVRKTFILLVGDLISLLGKAVFSIASLFSPAEVLAELAVFLTIGRDAGLFLARGIRMGLNLQGLLVAIMTTLQGPAAAALSGAMRVLGVTMATGLFGAFTASSMGLFDVSTLSVLGFTAAAAFLYPLLNGITKIPEAIALAFSSGNILISVGALAGKILLKFAPLGMMTVGAFLGAWAGGHFGNEMATMGGIAGALLAGKFVEAAMARLAVFFAELGTVAVLGWVGLGLTAVGVIGTWLFGSKATTLSQDLDNIIEKVRTLFGMKPNPIDVKTGLRLQDLLDAASMGIEINYKIDPIKMELTTDAAKEAVVKATEELADEIRKAKSDWDASGLTDDQRDLLQKKVKATAARVDAAAAAIPFSFKNFGKELEKRQTYRPDTNWGQFQLLQAQQFREAMYNADRIAIQTQMKLPQNATENKQLELRSQLKAMEASKSTRYNAAYSPLSETSQKLVNLTKEFDNLMPAPPKLVAHLKDVGNAILATTEKINSAKWGPWRSNETPEAMINELAKFQKEYKATAEEIIKYSTLMRHAQVFASRLSGIASKFDMKGVESKLDTNKIFADSDSAVNRMEKLSEAAEFLSKSLESVFDINAKNQIILNIEEVVKQKERLKEDSTQAYKFSAPAISKITDELNLGLGKSSSALSEALAKPVLDQLKDLQRQREDILSKPVKPINPDLIPQDFVRSTPENKMATESYQKDYTAWKARVKQQENLLKEFNKIKENDPFALDANKGASKAERELARLKIAEPVKPVLSMMDAKEQNAKMEQLRAKYKEDLAKYENDNFEYFDKYMDNVAKAFDLGDKLRLAEWIDVRAKPGKILETASKLNISINDLYANFGETVGNALLKEADDIEYAIAKATETQNLPELAKAQKQKVVMQAKLSIPEFKTRGAKATAMGVEESLIPGISKDVMNSLEAGFDKIREIDKYLEVHKKDITDEAYADKLKEKIAAQLEGKRAALTASSKTANFALQAMTNANLSGAQLKLISSTDLENLKTAELSVASLKLELDQSGDSADALSRYLDAMAQRSEAIYTASRNAASKTGTGILQILSEAGISGASKLSSLPNAIVKSLINLSNHIKDVKHNLEKPVDDNTFKALNEDLANTELAITAIKDKYASFQDKLGTVNEVFNINLNNMDFTALGNKLSSLLMNVAQSLKSELAKELEKGFLSVRAENIIKVLDNLSHTGAFIKFFTDFKKSVRESFTDGMKSAYDKIKAIAPNFGFSQSQFQMMDKATRDRYSKQARDASALSAIQSLNGLSKTQTGIINSQMPVSEMVDALIKSLDTKQLEQYTNLTSAPEDIQLKAANINLEAAKLNMEVARGPRSGVEPLSSFVKGASPKFRPDVERWDSLVQTAVKEFPNVTADMVKAVIEHESRGLNIAEKTKPGVKSTSFGLGQINNATASYLGVDKTDPASTIRGIAKYLSLNLKSFGNIPDAFRAYAVGPGGARQGLGYDKSQEFMETLRTGRAPRSAPITAKAVEATSDAIAKAVEKPIADFAVDQGELSKETIVALDTLIKAIEIQKPFEAYQLDLAKNRINPKINTPAEMLGTHGIKFGKDITSQLSENQIATATVLNEKLLQLQQDFNEHPSTELQRGISEYTAMLNSFTEGIIADAEDFDMARLLGLAKSGNKDKLIEKFSGIGKEVIPLMSEAEKSTAEAMSILRVSLQEELRAKQKAGESTVDTARKILDLDDALKTMGEGISETANMAREAGKTFSSGFTNSFKDAFKGLLNRDKQDGKSVLGTFANKIGTGIKDQVVDIFTNSLTENIGLGKNGKFTQLLTKTGSGLSTMFSGMGSGIKDIFSGNMTWDKMTSGISDWWSSMTSSTDISNMSPEQIQMAASEKFSKAVDKFSGMGGGVGQTAASSSMLSSALPFLGGAAGLAGAGWLLSKGVNLKDVTSAFNSNDSKSIFEGFGASSSSNLDPMFADTIAKSNSSISNTLDNLVTQKFSEINASDVKAAGYNPWSTLESGKGLPTKAIEDSWMESVSKWFDNIDFSWFTNMFKKGGFFGDLFENIGNLLPSAATGGQIKGPGTGTSDSIPTMLSNGEYVINAKATSKHLDLLNAINSGKTLKRASGGLVGGALNLGSSALSMFGGSGKLSKALNIGAMAGNLFDLFKSDPNDKLLAAAEHLDSAASKLEQFVGQGGIGGQTTANANISSMFRNKGQGSTATSGGIMDTIQGWFSNGQNIHGTDALGGQTFGVLQSDANPSVGSYGVLAADANPVSSTLSGDFIGPKLGQTTGGDSMFSGITDFFTNMDWGKMFGGFTDFFTNMDWGGMFGGIKDALGGLLGGGGGDGIMGMLSGLTGMLGFATGGQIKGPGTGTSDSIPAMLSNGEFVVNARSASKHMNLLHAINNGNKLSHFAIGGSVGTLATPIMATPTSSNYKDVKRKSQQVINLNITGDISRQTKAEIYKMMPTIADGVNSQNKETGYKR